MQHLRRVVAIMVAVAAAAVCLPSAASASPTLVFDVKTGAVLEHVEATRPWYPASLTKLLTIYVALTAVRDGQITMDTPLIVSRRAASMPPSKMGFKPGTEVTLGNALKMLMVKSANDLAITIAEGISGSVEDFAARMNVTAARLGLKESHFANPNGLPNPDHYSSARDLGIVARALFHDFPQYDGLYDIGAFQLGKMVVRTYNNMLGRYPGVNGMKTGYTCASGFNIVVSDVRGGRQLIAIVMGAPSVKQRTAEAAELLDAAYAGLFKPGPQLEDLPMSRYKRPQDIRAEVCGRRRRIVTDDGLPPQLQQNEPIEPAPGGLPPVEHDVNWAGLPHFTPIPVFVGPEPGWTGPVRGPIEAATPIAASANPSSKSEPTAPPQEVRPAAAKAKIMRAAALRRRRAYLRRLIARRIAKRRANRLRHSAAMIKHHSAPKRKTAASNKKANRFKPLSLRSADRRTHAERRDSE